MKVSLAHYRNVKQVLWIEVFQFHYLLNLIAFV